MDSKAAIVASALALAIAGGEPQTPQQPPTFRTGAELVRVDVTVLDRDGTPVTTLTRDDFSLEEDGAPQKIEAFKLLELNGQPAPGDDLALSIGSMAHAASELAREDVRVFLVFWDEYHIAPHVPARRMRTEVVSFLRTMIGPTDLVAIMDPWTPMSHLEFTRDRDRLVNQALALQGRQGVLVPPRNGAEEKHLEDPRAVPFRRSQVAFSALQSAVMHLGGLRDSRKAIIYVGSDYSLGRDTFSETAAMIETANDANVALYLITPEGLTIERRRAEMLRDVAANTGGESFVTNTPHLAFRRIVSQASAYYLLGYSPSPMRYDGRFHRVKVKVKRPGLQVRARSGYRAPTPTERGAASEAAAAAVLPGPIEAAFAQLARLRGGESLDEGPAIRTIVVPEPPLPSLQLSVPVLWRIRQPSELRAVLSRTPPPPSPLREFTRGDRLFLRFAVDGSSAAAATVSVGLIDRRGKRLTDLPAGRSTDPPGWTIDLPLQSIARGDFLIAIEALHGEERTAAYVPIRIR